MEDLPDDAVDDPPSTQLDASSTACLIYTSGTTGKPKGAMLTHGNFAANTRSLIDAWRMTPEDRLLLALPLFHVHGLGNGLHTWLALGYRTRLLDRFRKETIAEELLDFRPTVFFGVPAMYERLLETPPEVALEIGEHARLFVSGSAPLPPVTHQRFEDLFGHVILERYGMSETLMNLSNPYEGERRAGSVGFPLPGVSIRIVDPATGAARVDGETGEVQIKGANVFPGYWRREDATAEAFTDDGFFRSGDLGVRAPDGYHTLQGRMKELIISSGFNVYPREVEEFLLEQPGIKEAAVVGERHPVKGEVPAAYVVMEEGATFDGDSLTRCCRESLASFKAPVRFEVVGELPRNALGKIQKHLLGVRYN
ncbi:MAG: AMP-binding protein, partial [bacterium]|nr:AMP-binding protein [bacterium]